MILSNKKGGLFTPASSVFFFGCHALEICSSAGCEVKGSVRTSVDSVTAMAVVSSASHVIELADGADHGARVSLLHRLPSRGHQRLD